MTTRIPGKAVPPLIGLLRTSPRNSQPHCIASLPRHNSRRFLKSAIPPTRTYASLSTGEPRAPHPADPQFPQQRPHDPQSKELPRYFPLPEPQSPPSPQRRRSLRPYIYAFFFAFIGAAAGKFVSDFINPQEVPLPGSVEDRIFTALTHERAAKLPIVKALSTDPEWRSWDAYSTFTPEEKRHRITSGPLGGARGLGGYQRIFHNAKTGEFITVVWIGSALSGWPGVTHGGVTATILDESMGRCAIARFPVQTGMTAYLNFNFVKPVRTRGFCVVRANPIVDRSTERKGFVKGRLESLNGDALVLAEGLFVIPKNLPPSALKPIELSNPDVGF